MTASCPTCGKQLSSERGMRQHHTKVHDERLPNRKCKGCETTFYDHKARRTYCDDCNPNAGSHNGNWSDARYTTECDRCEREFSYYPSDKEGIYCSECVEKSDGFLGTPYHEVHEIERLERECEYCGVEITVLKSAAAYGAGRFCSHECLSNWMSDNWTGEGHPQGEGIDTGYGKSWWQVRSAARERDDHTCQRCGKTRDEIGREPDAHHIEPVNDFEDPQEAHDIDNVVCLCPGCHRGVERGELEIPDSLFDEK